MEKKKITLKTRLLISASLSIIAFIGVFIFSWTNSSGDYPEKIKEIEAAIEKEIGNIGKDKVITYKDKLGETRELIDDLDIFTWVNIDQITEPLNYSNEKIAKAKALVHFKKNPLSSTDYLWSDLWEKRFEVSKQNWKIETFKSKIFKSLGLGVVALVGSVIIVFLILLIIPWLWYFLLERLSEVSQAIRGK